MRDGKATRAAMIALLAAVAVTSASAQDSLTTDAPAAVHEARRTAVELPILCTENGGLVAMSQDGERAVRVLPRSVTCTFASWSPDGRRIVFVGDTHLDEELSGRGVYVAQADGTGMRKLARLVAEHTTRPVWSPVPSVDGSQWIVFDDAVGDSAAQHDLFAVRPDGTGLRNLTDTQDVGETYPAWSPEATRVAYVAEYKRNVRVRVHRTTLGARRAFETRSRVVKNVVVGDLTLYRGAPVVSHLANITDVRGSDLAFDARSAESHDFSGLAWSRTRDELAVVVRQAPRRDQSDIWLIDVVRPERARNVTRTGDASEASVAWSPDDSRLLFVRRGGESADGELCYARVGRTAGRIRVASLGSAAFRDPVDWQRVNPQRAAELVARQHRESTPPGPVEASLEQR